MEFLVSVVIPAICLIVYITISGMFYRIALEKGYDNMSRWGVCFWLGIVGWIYVASLPDLKVREALGIEDEETDDEETDDEETDDDVNDMSVEHQEGTYSDKTIFECPQCKTPLPRGVRSCPVCNLEFDWDE